VNELKAIDWRLNELVIMPVTKLEPPTTQSPVSDAKRLLRAPNAAATDRRGHRGRDVVVGSPLLPKGCSVPQTQHVASRRQKQGGRCVISPDSGHL